MLQGLFFICLGVALFAEIFFLNDFEDSIFQLIGFPYLELLQLLGLAVFLLFFIPMVIFFKIISKKEIELLEQFLPKKSRISKIMRKILHLVKKILRS